MNENRHPIDDLFRDGLDQYSVEAPMHVWERIDQKRTPVYKLTNNFKQNARWYMSVAAGLVLMSSVVFLLNSDDKVQQTTQLEVQEEKAVQQTTPAVNQENTLEFPVNAEVETPSEPVSRPAQTTNAPAFQSRNMETANAPAAPSNISPTHPILEAMEGGVVIPEQTATEEEEEEIVLEEGAVTLAEVPEVLPEIQEPKTASTDPVNNDPAVAPEKKEETKVAPPITPSPWAIEFLGSYDFVTRNMSHPDPNYVSARNHNEKVQGAYTLSLRAQYRFNPIWSIRGGLSYSRINEKLDLSYTTYSSEIVDRQVSGYIVDPINGPTKVTYTVRDTIHNSTSKQISSNNHYTFIDIPVLLTYQAYTSDKWSLGVSGGPVFNVAFRQYGNILAPSVNDVISLNGNSNPYRKYAGVNLMLNASAAYKLNRHFDFLFEPGVRLGLTPLTNSITGMTQKYNSFNLATGLRYNF
ncbi:MAG: outer membrane beta-barrel protein [Bacteroidota bacterium]|nr:outer membrane beta-barrel protein [Bacteroidota bacterium]MDX5431295.1 outer membrane beta-barrel protein [Bacteroidota bacterium]MDX5470033.1 outer membrane beta-barrel protein [Bacteroidota bacterium]